MRPAFGTQHELTKTSTRCKRKIIDGLLARPQVTSNIAIEQVPALGSNEVRGSYG